MESPRIVYGIDNEIIAFALGVLPEPQKTLDIEFDERYLLEVLP